MAKSSPRPEVAVDTGVIKLMQEYFLNKDEVKSIKKERNEMWLSDNNKCPKEYSLSPEAKNVDCIEMKRYSDYPEEIELCSFCKRRHEYYNKIKKLSSRNTGILLSVRRRVL